MKRGLNFIVCIVLVAILSFSFVSAGFFSDFFGKITGEIIDQDSSSDNGFCTFPSMSSITGIHTYGDCIEEGGEWTCYSDGGCPSNYECSNGACISSGEIEQGCTGISDTGVDCTTVTTEVICDKLGCIWNGFGEGVGEVSSCGDGILDDGEECDDKNKIDGDGCSSDCFIEKDLFGCKDLNESDTVYCENFVEALCLQLDGVYCLWVDENNCGDGILDDGEECDGASNCREGCFCKQGYNADGNGNCIKQIACADSDGGINYYIEGSCVDSIGTYDDSCGGDGLVEYWCENDSCTTSEALFICPTGCDGNSCELPSGSSSAVCVASPGKSSVDVEPGTRVQDKESDSVYYCDPSSLSFSKTKEIGVSCLADYECESNSCLDGECASVLTELAEQASILNKIWCFLSSGLSSSNEAFYVCLKDSSSSGGKPGDNVDEII